MISGRTSGASLFRDANVAALNGPSGGRTRRLNGALWLGVVLTVAGCTTVGPDFVQPVATVPAKWQETDSTIVVTRPAEPDRWWEVFGDPILGQLIEIAYRNNYSLKVAGLKVLEARAQLGIAIGTLYPQVQQANGNVNYTSASKNAANTAAGDLGFWEYAVGASIGWELDFWGKFRRSIESADANLLANVAAYDSVLVLLVAQVADTYVAIRTAEAQLKVAYENVAIQQRSLKITEARFRGGDVGELDMLQARTQLLGTQASIPPIESGLQQARNALGTLLGQPPGGLGRILELGRASSPSRRSRSWQAPRRSSCAGVPTCARPNWLPRRKAPQSAWPRPISIRASG